MEFEKQMKYPEDKNPAFHPNLEMTSWSLASKDYNTFFDFLKDVQKWQKNRDEKLEMKKKQRKAD